MKTSWLILLAAFFGALANPGRAPADDDVGGPNIGERLFLETRFAEFFFTNCGGDANFQLTNGDPVMDFTVSPIFGNLPGPFAGQSMNCRACHLVEEQETTENRIYCDFATRSPVPNVGDGQTTTHRNAMTLVDSLLPRQVPQFLHNDGQFIDPIDLIVTTLTGRNFGWQPTEYATAIHHIANIIRNDDGTGGLAQQYGGSSYTETFAQGDEIPPQYLISPNNYMDLTITNPAQPGYATDEEIVENVASLIEQYLETLTFSFDEEGNFNGSPYDAFLAANGLPRQPDYGEAPIHYSQRLLQQINALANPQFITDPADGSFTTHNLLFQFGTNELAGLKIFFRTNGSAGATGNCVSCHSPPTFTDFIFHNNGAAQAEFDAINGLGSFLNLNVPGYAVRQSNYNAYLPPTTNHPYATGLFITPPTTNNPQAVDLGLWNVYANPDFTAPQASLQEILPQLLFLRPPQITGAALSGNQLVFSGTSGPPGWPYYVLASTNLALPANRWAMVASNIVDSQGNFAFTNATIAAAPRNFYQVALMAPTPELALPAMIALFKTPSVRDISSSEPYLHTGSMDTVEEVIAFYENTSALAQAGAIRNGDPQLSVISLNNAAVAPLAAFLRSLNEDYTDIPCPCQ